MRTAEVRWRGRAAQTGARPRAVRRDSPMRSCEDRGRREDQPRWVIVRVEQQSDRHPVGGQAGDPGEIAGGAAEVADRLDPTGEDALLDSQAVADHASL